MNNVQILKLTEGLGGEYLTKEIIKRSKDKNIIYLTEDVLLNTKCVQELAKYLENLIQRNKELEEENIHWKGQYHLLSRKINVIPKSKVKEKMQNDIKTNEHTILGGRRNGKTLEYGIRLGRIQMCEELLEGGE